MVFNFIKIIILFQHHSMTPTRHHSINKIDFVNNYQYRLISIQSSNMTVSRVFLVLTIATSVFSQLSSIQEQIQSIEEQIEYFQGIDMLLSPARPSQNIAPQQQEIQNISISQLPMNEYSNHCEIFSQVPIQFILTFQTHRHIYFLVNGHGTDGKNSTIYNINCEVVSVLTSMVTGVICDRKFCQHGVALFLAQKQEIIQCNQNDNFATCTHFSNPQRSLVGAVSRSKGMSNTEVYLSFPTGISVFNIGQGSKRLTVPIEPGSKIVQIMDRHPNALVMTDKGWIYTFQNSHYSFSLAKCPFISQDSWMFVSNPYSQFLFILTTSTIFKVQLKSQSSTCYVEAVILLTSPIIVEGGWGNMQISEYQGMMFMGKQVINLETGEVKQLSQCGDKPSLNFQPIKNNYRKGIYVVSCCQEESGTCGAVVFKIASENKGNDENKGQFVAIVSILGLFVFLVYYFLKPMAINIGDYEKEFSNTRNQAYRTTPTATSKVEKMATSKVEKMATSKVEKMATSKVEKMATSKVDKIIKGRNGKKEKQI